MPDGRGSLASQNVASKRTERTFMRRQRSHEILPFLCLTSDANRGRGAEDMVILWRGWTYALSVTSRLDAVEVGGRKSDQN